VVRQKGPAAKMGQPVRTDEFTLNAYRSSKFVIDRAIFAASCPCGSCSCACQADLFNKLIRACHTSSSPEPMHPYELQRAAITAERTKILPGRPTARTNLSCSATLQQQCSGNRTCQMRLNWLSPWPKGGTTPFVASFRAMQSSF
jgi:hypothetical protein